MLARAPRWLGIISGVFLISACVIESSRPSTPEIEGTNFEVRVSYENKSEGGSSNGSSRGHSTLAERILKADRSGVLIEYDFPEDTTEEERLPEWRYPTRLLVESNGTVRLMNADELETRNFDWRSRANISEDACGSWYFTWNAFKVECDPNSMIADLEAFRVPVLHIQEGTEISEPGAVSAEPLLLTQKSPRRFRANFDLDPEVIRQARAEEDVIVSKFLDDDPITFDQALERRAAEEISGTLTTTLELDNEGRVVKRTRLSLISITLPDGLSERQTSSQTTIREIQPD
ncbi:hypothetical protein [Hyphomonas sp.]|jgi:hypothetical protein|uniref:hypothetical protein n=1 Tax=Hyphomonas sp. TaxID=87 RepID=UPI0032D917F9